MHGAPDPPVESMLVVEPVFVALAQFRRGRRPLATPWQSSDRAYAGPGTFISTWKIAQAITVLTAKELDIPSCRSTCLEFLRLPRSCAGVASNQRHAKHLPAVRQDRGDSSNHGGSHDITHVSIEFKSRLGMLHEIF